MTSSTSIRRCCRALAMAGFLTCAGAPTSVSGAASPTPPASDAQVIAQGIVEFDGSSLVWSVDELTFPTDSDTDIDVAAPTFLHPTAGVLDVTDDNVRVRLAPGEATLVGPDDKALLGVAGPAAATAWRIALTDSGTDDATPGGAPFAPGPALREVELLGDVMGAGDVLEIADRELPVLVLVTSGPLSAGGVGVAPAELLTGDAIQFDGPVTLSNLGEQTATVVAAVIGEPIVDDPPTTTTSTSTSTTVAPTTAAPTSTVPPTTITPTTTPPAPPTTVAVDSDLDGLTDAEEIDFIGTDPNNPDSDGDVLSDGDEVTNSGTDPNDADTDDDDLDDYIELFGQNTDPFVADSDGDTIPDGDEVNLHFTDPLLTDTDSDDVDDYQEIANHGTDPLVADTDGDTFTDGIELSGGFDPLDPASHP